MKTEIQSKIDKLKELENTLPNEYFGSEESVKALIQNFKMFFQNIDLYKDNPYIINLWGPTGTGKTEPVMRIIQELNLPNKYFDVGEFMKNSTSYLNNYLEDCFSDKTSLANIIIFDEVQLIKTKEENGSETNSASSRAFWGILDRGTLVSNDIDIFHNRKILQTLEFLDIVLNKYSGNYVNGCLILEEHLDEEDKEKGNEVHIIDADLFKRILESAPNFVSNYFSLDGSFLYNMSSQLKNSWLSSDINKIDGLIIKWLKYQSVYNDINAAKDFVQKALVHLQSQTNILSFNPLIVINIGNLDSIYQKLGADISTDYNSINFIHESSLDINNLDVKVALSKMYRPEQVARFGENHIVYRTLNSDAYKRIIHEQLNFLFTTAFPDIKGSNNEALCLDSRLVELIYKEYANPINGARSVISGANSIGLYLVNQLREFTKEKGCLKITNINTISLDEVSGSWFLEVSCNNTKNLYMYGFENSLGLKSVRKVIKDYDKYESFERTCYHEAGHAVLAKHFNRRLLKIEANSNNLIENGHVEYIGNQYLQTKEECLNSIIITLAGAYSERFFFGSERLGCSSDKSDITLSIRNYLLNTFTTNGFYFSDDTGLIEPLPEKDKFSYFKDLLVSKYLFAQCSIRTKILIRKYNKTIKELAKRLIKNRGYMDHLDLEKFFNGG